jgi:phosphoenolpyruvate-protein kinase (PTS system EI component)
VTVCGELAADPLGALALAALRVDSLSVPVNNFAAARRCLAGHSPASLAGLRPDLLRCRTAGDVRARLRAACDLAERPRP